MPPRTRFRPQIDPNNGDIGYQLGVLTTQIDQVFGLIDDLTSTTEAHASSSDSRLAGIEGRLAAIEPPVQAIVAGKAQKVEASQERKRAIEDKLALFGVGAIVAKLPDILNLVHRVVHL